jgi:nifR3 family TIM-barrel protein
MAGYTDIIWRQLLDELGGVGYMVTELISAEAVCRRSSKTLEMIRDLHGQTPQMIQLFGSDIKAFSEAARIVESETTYAGIDLNLGCPARKVVRKGAGSALLAEPLHLAALVRELRKVVRGVLTAKIRLGLSQVNVLENAAVLQDEGVDALAVHFRLQKQGYNQPADWSWAPLVRERLRIPLIGNGDIFDEKTALERLELVDGLLLGRASMGDPLLFARMADITPRPGLKQVLQRFIELVELHLPPERRVNRIKAQARFLTGRRRSNRQLRLAINESRQFDEVTAHLLTLASEEEGVHG